MNLGPHWDCAVKSARTMCHGKSGSDPLSPSMSQPERAKALGPERTNPKLSRKLNSIPSFPHQVLLPMSRSPKRFRAHKSRITISMLEGSVSIVPASKDLNSNVSPCACAYRSGKACAGHFFSGDIPFASLKCTELAQAQFCPQGMNVPSKTSSLGQAIHTLKPDRTSTETKSAAKQAQKEGSETLTIRARMSAARSSCCSKYQFATNGAAPNARCTI
jgi:hypothetical protein